MFSSFSAAALLGTLLVAHLAWEPTLGVVGRQCKRKKDMLREELGDGGRWMRGGGGRDGGENGPV